jgi:hypothetical protein
MLDWDLGICNKIIVNILWIINEEVSGDLCPTLVLNAYYGFFLLALGEGTIELE